MLAFVYLAASCVTTQSLQSKDNHRWHSIASINEVENYVDTASIEKRDASAFAYEKRIYLSDTSKESYISKIREAYKILGKAEKADKWNDFSYCIYYCEYDCLNKRFRVLSVQDFDSKGSIIEKTKPKKGKEYWIDVNNDTLGYYTLFYVCDFE